jgi:hypothetical protein
MLYNFWSHELNNLHQLAWDIGARARGRKEGTEEGEPGAHIGSITWRVFWLVFVMIAIEEGVSPHDDEGRSFGQRALLATGRFFGGLWPGMNSITNAAFHGYEPSVGGLGYFYKLITDSVKDVQKGGKNMWIQHALTWLGLFGVPGTGASTGRMLRGEANRQQRREVPRPGHIADWTTLYRTGRVPRGH